MSALAGDHPVVVALREERDQAKATATGQQKRAAKLQAEVERLHKLALTLAESATDEDLDRYGLARKAEVERLREEIKAQNGWAHDNLREVERLREALRLFVAACPRRPSDRLMLAALIAAEQALREDGTDG